jgi:thioredoxin 1
MSYRKLSSIGQTVKEKYDILVNEIRTKEDKANVISSNKVCLVDVYADWCGPCKIIAPKYKEMFKNYNVNGVCAIVKEDVELGLSPNVQVIPTFQFYINGQFDSIITGADMSIVEQKLVELLQS